MKRRYRDQIIVLFLMGTLALNYPLLSVVNRQHLFWGIPLLYLYIFLVWLVIIALMAFIAERSSFRNDDRTGI
jgi:hypothetical protein